ncbi:MAG: tetratricopeptide repeat protein, partial [Anaerolineae bacterium]|nr:tetratricopeptide repeat protein [Anaerolineae bacterium]
RLEKPKITVNKKLIIRLLGNTVIELDGRLISDSLPSRAAEALLIYLVCHDRPIPRETLADLLWSERTQKQGLTNLRTILTPLRRELDDYLIITRQMLAFNHAAPYWLDAAEFESQLTSLQPQLQAAAPLSPEAARQLQTALDLYQGDFLASFALKEGPEFEAWILLQRERLKRLAAMGLEHFVTHSLSRGNYHPGLRYVDQLLELDAYNEVAQRQRMWLLVRSGQPHAALQQFETFSQLLADELGLEPMPETRHLYRHIKTARTFRLNNLPPQTGPLVGRTIELQRLEGFLTNPDCRLLTLVGPGGIGKTRLAIEAAGHYQSSLLHGVCFVSIPALVTEEVLVSSLAGSLKLALDGMVDPREQLLKALQEREILLLLDSFEHALAPQPALRSEEANGGHTSQNSTGHENGAADVRNLLSTILAFAPQVKLLVTSRERLNLEEEWFFQVDGLPVPDDAIQPAQVTTYSAVQLFLQNASRVQSGFAPTETDVLAIGRICRLVEGLPLGINLATAWIKVLPCAQIATEIESNLTFLQSPTHTVTHRHHSIEAVFDHSWQRLTNDEQQVLSRLSVFQGGFTIDAAQQVTDTTVLLLAGLVDKSWLTLNPEGRYDAHELLRRYAALKLGITDAGSLDKANMTEAEIDIRTRHAAYYAAFLSSRQTRIINENQFEAMAEIEVEFDNVRAAWQWMLTHGLVTLVDQCMECLWHFLELKNQFNEADEMYGQAIEAFARYSEAGKMENTPLLDLDAQYDRVYGRILIRQGWFHMRLSRFDSAEALLYQGLERVRRTGDRVETGRGMQHLGLIADVRGRYEEAEKLFRESFAILKSSPHSTHFDLSSVGTLGFLLMKMGQFEAAQPFLDESAFHYRQIGNMRGISAISAFMGAVFIQQGNYHEAKLSLLKALDFQEKIGDWAYMRMTLDWLGEAYEGAGEYSEAKTYYEKSLTVSQGNGDWAGVAQALGHLGRVCVTLNAYQQAKQCLYEAFDIATAIQSWPVIIDGLVSMADWLVKNGDLPRALELLPLTLNHPSCDPRTKHRAQQIYTQLLDTAPETTPTPESPHRPIEAIVSNFLAEWEYMTSRRYLSSPTVAVRHIID